MNNEEREVLASVTWQARGGVDLSSSNAERGVSIALARIERLEIMFAKLCDQMGLAYVGDAWIQAIPDRKIDAMSSDANIR